MFTLDMRQNSFGKKNKNKNKNNKNEIMKIKIKIIKNKK